ncbi:methyltransferase domain-containing protein [Murinocardiopsis flavida]|nr:methyltransferase domain-containing protein [Murinocardiopsis flavida]
MLGRDVEGWRDLLPKQHERVQEAIHGDFAIVTQVDDGHPAGDDGRGKLATSSISQPSIVMAMLHALDAADGHTVLEIGTGTGWNAALLCERLGDAQVTSVEVDPEVARTARAPLEGQGYKPAVITGDGAAGVVDRAPYDRVLATVAAHEVPSAWIAQTRPGGVVVTPWATWFSPGALLRLVVHCDGSASGRFVGYAPFMMLRAQRSASPLGHWRDIVNEDDPAAQAGRTRTNPRWIAHRDDGWRLVAGHLVPGIDFVSFEAKDDSGEASVFVYDRGAGSGSWALGEYEPGRDDWETKVCGSRDLWAEIGRAWDAWQRAGRPGRERLGLTVAAAGTQALWADAPGNVLG